MVVKSREVQTGLARGLLQGGEGPGRWCTELGSVGTTGGPGMLGTWRTEYVAAMFCGWGSGKLGQGWGALVHCLPPIAVLSCVGVWGRVPLGLCPACLSQAQRRWSYGLPPGTSPHQP